MARRKKNPWTSTSEVLLWILFVALIFPAVFAGYAVGHYTSLGKPPKTVTETVGSSTGSTTTATTTTSSSGGNIAAGKSVFAAQGCGGCHTFSAAGASGAIGPNLDNAIAGDAKSDHKALPDFIKESIVNPSAYISKAGTWSVQMPGNFGAALSATQLNDLVAFILSGTSK